MASSHLDVGALAVRAVLENELLQIEEGPFVVHPLSDLHDRRPCVVRESSGAVLALLISHDEGNRHGLLKDGPVADLLLHREFELETPTVRLRPDP